MGRRCVREGALTTLKLCMKSSVMTTAKLSGVSISRSLSSAATMPRWSAAGPLHKSLQTVSGPLASRLCYTCTPHHPSRRRRTYATASASCDNIAVLGGGLTGLTTAYYLAKKLPPSTKITLYEAGDRLGGWIRTDKVPVDVGGVSGTVNFERGPRTLSSLRGSTWRFDDLVLYDLALDLGLRISSPPDQSRYIFYPDHLVSLPPHPLQMFSEPLFIQSFWAGLHFLVKRYFRGGGNKGIGLPPGDISVAEWLYEVCGSRAVVDNMVSAMIHGIYGGDVYKLSARSVLEQFYWWYYLPKAGPEICNMAESEKTLLDTLGADEQIRKMALRARGSLLHFGAGGMESLTIALADALAGQPNVDIRLQEPVQAVAYDGESGQVQIRTASGRTGDAPRAYNKVVSTLTSQDLARASGDLLPTLDQTQAVSIMTVNLWYPEPNLNPTGFGYLIPRAISRDDNPHRALGVFFDSDVGVAGDSAVEPRGTKLFVLMGGHYYDSDGDGGASAPPVPSEDEAVEQAKSLVEAHLGIPRSTPCFAMARYARECIPQHTVGHGDRMSALDRELRDRFGGALAVAGGSYTRVGAMGALRGGYDVAQKVIEESEATGGAGTTRWKTTGLEQFSAPAAAFAGVHTSLIPVRRFKQRQ